MNDPQPQADRPPLGPLQIPLWRMFVVMTVVAVLVSLVASGGFAALGAALTVGWLIGLIVAAFVVARLGWRVWAVVAGSVLGAAMAILIALSSRTLERPHSAAAEHARSGQPIGGVATIWAATSACVGAMAGVAVAWTAHERWRQLPGCAEKGSAGPEATRRSRLRRVFAVMGVLVFGLGVIFACCGDFRAGSVLIFGVILMFLSTTPSPGSTIKEPPR